MPETTLTVQEIVQTGLAPTLAAANVDGSKFSNTGREFLVVANASVAPITVTVEFNPANRAALEPSGLTVPDRIVSVPAGATRELGPFPPSQFSDNSNFAHVDFSDVTTVTVAAKRFANNPG